MSHQTIWREFAVVELKWKKAQHAPYINKAHRVLRLARAKELVHILQKELKLVIFLDKYYVYLSSNPGVIYCTRNSNEAWHEDCVILTFKKFLVCVIVWGYIIYGRKGPLIVLEYPGGKGGGITAKKYIEQILEGYLLDFYK